MSGHSKWSTIKRKKAAVDAKRGKIFTRLLREIQVAAKMGGASPDANPRLRSAVQAAKAQSVPNDNIDKAIKRGSGSLEGVDYEEIMYEGYGPGGVAILVKTLTDNKNRTAADVRSTFSRYGGNMGSANSVAYLFKEKGIVSLPIGLVTEDELLSLALDAGASDVKAEGDFWQVECEPTSFEQVRAALSKLSDKLEGEIRLAADTNTLVKGSDAQNLLKLLDMLDELDDVQNVVTNFSMDDAELELYSK